MKTLRRFSAKHQILPESCYLSGVTIPKFEHSREPKQISRGEHNGDAVRVKTFRCFSKVEEDKVKKVRDSVPTGDEHNTITVSGAISESSRGGR